MLKATIRLGLMAGASCLLLAQSPAALAQDASQQWGTFGVQTDRMDPAVKPGDDFNLHVNGRWIAETPFPGDRSRFGSFDELDELSRNRLKGILDEIAASTPAPGSPQERIAAAYKAFMDTDAIEAAGMAPAQPMLQRIWAAKNREDLVSLFAQPGIASPLNSSIDTDAKQSDRYILGVSQGGLGLPDRDYYLQHTPRNIEIRAKYLDYLTFLLGKAGYQDPAGAARSVMALETDLARAQWDRAVQRNRELTYNKLTLEEARALPDGALLAGFVSQVSGGKAVDMDVAQMPFTAAEAAQARIPAEVLARQGGGVPQTLRLIAEAPMATWQAWMAARFLDSFAAYLPREIDDAAFAFNGKLLKGVPEQAPRWKRGIGAVEGQVGELLGQVYAERYFPAANKAAMDDLVANLRRAMAANLADLSWMGPETRAQAQAKLDTFLPKIGAPVRFKSYDGLSLDARTPLANALAAGAWSQGFEMGKLGKPVDKTEWFMLPQTINAYYNWGFNEIVFPAAILQPPFFNVSADPAVNYGGIGAVIGHEMGHGFDDQGAKSDGNGNLTDWWTPADKARFQALQDKLGAQYATFCPFDDGKTCVNPKLTMGENIGDLGGLSLAYRAYRLSLGGKEAPVIDGFTGDQRFFMAWAQVWRSKAREARARQLLVIDPHSPPEYRINGIVRNFDEWYRAFGVKPGDKLYLPPAQRVRIW